MVSSSKKEEATEKITDVYVMSLLEWEIIVCVDVFRHLFGSNEKMNASSTVANLFLMLW